MKIHREGYMSIAIAALIFGVLNLANFSLLSDSFPNVALLIFFLTLALFLFLVSFFRIPARTLTINDGKIICPADGKVVVIEEVTDEELKITNSQRWKRLPEGKSIQDITSKDEIKKQLMGNTVNMIKDNAQQGGGGAMAKIHIQKLVKLAQYLDKKGRYREADEILNLM
jgi:uncharacterized Zn finger protein (UPF0148 family)